MPFKVLLSQIPDKAAFAATVAEHAKKLKAFNNVVGQPLPTAHPLVEASVRRVQRNNGADDYLVDFVIEDDTPKTPPAQIASLDEKKDILQAAVVAAENKAKFAILPRRKIRLAGLKVNAAVSVPEEQRTAEQKEDLASYQHLQAAWRRIELIGAQAESDIEDLDQNGVDNWKPPTF